MTSVFIISYSLYKEHIMASLATVNNAHPLVRWERYSPFSLGMEQMFSRLDALADSGTSFPPYNIIKASDNTVRLEIALAGYKKEQLEVAVERGVLTVSATKGDNLDETGEYLHRAVAKRTFAKNWQLADNAVVNEVSFVDGLLTISVGLEVPEEQKRRLLPIV